MRILLLFILFHSCNLLCGGITISNNGTPQVAIVIDDNASSAAILNAAQLLADILEESTQTVLGIYQNADKPDGLVPIVLSIGEGVEWQSADEEEFEISITDSDIHIMGATPRAVVFGISYFLENEVGVYWLNFAGDRIVPKHSRLVFNRKTVRQRPGINVRDLMPAGVGITKRYSVNVNLLEETWAFWRLNGSFGPRHVPGMNADAYGGYRDSLMTHGAHTMGTTFLQPDVLFTSSPEYFALVDGKRTKLAYSFSNPGLAEQMAKELEPRIRQSGEGVYVVSPPDNWLFCQSDAETAMLEKYGERSGAYVNFMNEVTKGLGPKLRDAHLELLAYTAYISPPQNINLDPSVILRFCPITRYHWEALDAPINEPWLEKLQAWKAIAADVRIWDYPGQYANSYSRDGTMAAYQGYNRLFPQPNIYVHGRDLSLYYEMGVNGVFLETDSGMAELYCESEPRYWLMAKLLWDPSQDSRKLLEDFCDVYYGEAGAYAIAYFDLLEAAYTQDTVRQRGHVGQMDQQTFLNRDFFEAAHALFEEGTDKIGGNEEKLKRWNRLRASLDLATLFLYDENDTNISATTNSINREQIESRLRTTHVEMVCKYFTDYQVDVALLEINNILRAARASLNSNTAIR